MLRLAGAGITSFSVIPLRLGILLGLVTSLFAFYQLGEALYVHYFTGRTLPGWTSTFGVMTLLFGVMFILMGILGEYLGRILLEVRGRPRFIVADAIGEPAGGEPPPVRRPRGGALRAAMRTFPLEPRYRPQWERFATEHPAATVAHDLRWATVVESSYGHQPRHLMAFDGDAVAGILPLFLVDGGPLGRSLVSSPFLTYGGVAARG
jgi:hypothetical protein